MIQFFLIPIAAESALIAPVSPPPPAPPLKSGSFSCAMYGRDGLTFTLSGKMTGWSAPSPGQEAAKFDLQTTDDLGLSGLFEVGLNPTEMHFFRYRSETRTSVEGWFRASFGPTGTMVIQRRIIGSGWPMEYVGLCDVHLSTAEIAQ